MGFSFGTLCKILLGVGLGVLAASCLAVTVCFGGYANNHTAMEKIESTLNFRSESSMYSCAIAITVLGCLAAATALGAIVLSAIIEEQTMILIIVGGIAALFGFGCIIAEGVYTLQIVKNDAEASMDFTDQSHKNAQDYIKKAIEELYKQGAYNLEKDYSLKDLPSWNEAKNKLGTVSNGRVITYNSIWSHDHPDNNITLYTSNSFIYSYYGNQQSSIVASLKFYAKGSAQTKNRYCWFKNKDRNDIKCANINGKKFTNCEITYGLDDNLFLNEKIVVGSYYSVQDLKNSDKVSSANYLVSNFPFAYKKLTYEDIQDILKQQEDSSVDYDECKHNAFSFEDSSNKFKVSGKKYAKARLSETKKYFSEPSEDYVNMAPSKPKNYEDYEKKCEEYNGNSGDENEKQESDDIVCKEDISISRVWEYVQDRYKDGNKGKIAPSIKKYYMRNARSENNNLYRNDNFLYTIALINLILQIVAILFWACGRFLDLLLGGRSLEKTPSVGEGKNF